MVRIIINKVRIVSIKLLDFNKIIIIIFWGPVTYQYFVENYIMSFNLHILNTILMTKYIMIFIIDFPYFKVNHIIIISNKVQ